MVEMIPRRQSTSEPAHQKRVKREPPGQSVRDTLTQNKVSTQNKDVELFTNARMRCMLSMRIGLLGNICDLRHRNVEQSDDVLVVDGFLAVG
jgi:hypothetical protein